MDKNLKPVKSQIPQRKVLIIEDDPHWQLVICMALKSVDKNIKFKCVRTAQEASKILAQYTRQDLIISDYFLEGNITGFEFWRMCRSAQQQTPFLMVSGLQVEEFLDLVPKEADCPLYLSKPFHVESLKLLLNWHLVSQPQKPKNNWRRHQKTFK